MVRDGYRKVEQLGVAEEIIKCRLKGEKVEDIAKKTGVSIATVSKFFNEWKQDLSPEIQRRLNKTIFQLIDDLDYLRNLGFKKLYEYENDEKTFIRMFNSLLNYLDKALKFLNLFQTKTGVSKSRIEKVERVVTPVEFR